VEAKLSTMDLGTCCSKCEAITGSPDGIRSLNGEDGYEHHEWHEMQKSAHRGCSLCRTVMNRIEIQHPEVMGRPEHQLGNSTGGKMLVRPEWDHSSGGTEHEKINAPFGNCILRKLSFHMDTEKLSIKVSFDIETAYGKSGSITFR
jgi:hypothetical protein